MRFFADTFRVLRDTTWPNRKQRWTDFWSVLQYTFFFVVIIYLFDKVISQGIVALLNMF